MKKFICYMIMIVFLLATVSCGSDKNVAIKEKKEGEEATVKVYTFQQYGLLDTDKRNPKVQYKVVWGNIFWSVVLSGTIFVPVILIGWYVYEPVGPAIEGEPGAISSPEKR